MAGNPFAADFSTKSDITTAGALMMSALQERAKALDFSKVGEGIQTMLNPFEELENKAQDIRATQTAELINRLSPDAVEDMYKQGFNLAGFLAEQGIDPNNQAISNAWAGQQATRVQRGRQKLQDEIKQAYELSGKSMAPAEFLQRYRAEHPDIPAEYYPFNADFLGSIDESAAQTNLIKQRAGEGGRIEDYAKQNASAQEKAVEVYADLYADRFRKEFNTELSVMNAANQSRESIMNARQVALTRFRDMLRDNNIDPQSDVGKLYVRTFDKFLLGNIQDAETAAEINLQSLKASLSEQERLFRENYSTTYDYLFNTENEKSPIKAKDFAAVQKALKNNPTGKKINNSYTQDRLARFIRDQNVFEDGDEDVYDKVTDWLIGHPDVLAQYVEGQDLVRQQQTYQAKASEFTANNIAKRVSKEKEE